MILSCPQIDFTGKQVERKSFDLCQNKIEKKIRQCITYDGITASPQQK